MEQIYGGIPDTIGFSYLLPTADSFTSENDRTIVCVFLAAEPGKIGLFDPAA